MEICRRIEVAANNLGVECYFVGPDGFILQNGKHISSLGVDFVIVFDPAQITLFDTFVYHLMWFVPGLIHEEHAITYDRLSDNCDDHLCFPAKQLLEYYQDYYATVNSNFLFPSAPYNYVCKPRVFTGKEGNKYKAFYAGINVDAKNVRHEELFKRLESKDLVDLYGPRQINGKQNWQGFKSYRGEINFDGHSIIETANRSGVTLALHHFVHARFSMPTNRLFEGVAAGTLVVTERMSFIEEAFGDSIFYLDPCLSEEERASKVEEIINWANTHPEAAREKISRAQAIFLDRFELTKVIKSICDQHVARKNYLIQESIARINKASITIVCEIFNEKEFELQLKNITHQDYQKFSLLLIIRTRDISDDLKSLLSHVSSKYESVVVQADKKNIFVDDAEKPLLDILKGNIRSDYFCICHPLQYWHSNHIRSLVDDAVTTGAFATYSGSYYINENYRQIPVLISEIEALDAKLFNCVIPKDRNLLNLIQRELPISCMLFKTESLQLVTDKELRNITFYMHLALLVLLRAKNKSISYDKKITLLYSRPPVENVAELDRILYQQPFRLNSMMSANSLSYVVRSSFRFNSSVNEFLSEYKRKLPIIYKNDDVLPFGLFLKFKSKLKICLLVNLAISLSLILYLVYTTI